MALNQDNVDVLVVGAGLAGIMAARMLENKGISVSVLDKERSVGGRMATQRVGDGLADHGAQFFTARTPEFQAMIDQWMNENLVFVWSHGFSDGSLQSPSPQEGFPRYAVHGGVNALMQHLARDLKRVRVRSEVVTATCDDDGWILQDYDGNIFHGKVLMLTCPVPQSLEILDAGATLLTREDQSILAAIEYFPCLTGMFWVDGRVRLPQPGALHRKNANISWIGDNQQKGISPNATIITVQASADYSAQLWSAPDERVLNALRTDLQMYLADDATIREAQLKRWRYSQPATTYEGRYFHANNDPMLLFAGDAFGGPRVEGAVLSGMAAGKAVMEAFAVG